MVPICLPVVGCPASLGGDLAGAAARAVLSAVSSGLVQAAAYLATGVGHLITSPKPQLTSPSFSAELSRMREVGLLVVLPILCLATIGPVLRQDGRRLARVWGIGLPVAVLAGLVVAELTQDALSVTDLLCAVVTRGGPSISTALADLLSPKSLAGMPTFVQIALAVLVSAGALAVWLELLVRSAGVYVATFFMPVALVAFVWPTTAGMAKRAVEILVALVLSKFVIIATLSLGFTTMSAPGVDQTMAGCGIVALAAFAPFVAFRLAPVVEASAIAHLEGLSRRPVRAAASVAAAPANPALQTVMRAASRPVGGGGVGVAEALAPTLPPAPVDYPDPVGRADG